jgi:hypothetical protein
VLLAHVANSSRWIAARTAIFVATGWHMGCSAGVMLRDVMCVLCSVGLLACSTQTTLPAATAVGLSGAMEGDDGTVRLVDAHGDELHLRSGDSLTIATTAGAVTEVPASRMCRSAEGLSMRVERGSCANATWIAAWDELASIHVDQFDGAATVAVSTAAAVIVVGIIVVAASSKDDGSKGSGGGKEKSKSKQGAPSSSSSGSGHALATPTRGGSSGGGAPAPRPSSSHHAGSHRHGGGVVFAPQVLVLNGGGTSSSPQPAEVDEQASLAAAPTDMEPLFSARAQRRAQWQPSLRLEAGGCVLQDRCLAESLRLGLLIGDLVELSGGGRWEQVSSGASWLGVVGLGMQGKFTRWPSLALALSAQVAFGSAVRVMSSAGLRFRPGGDIWVGVQPLGLTYFEKESRLAYTPSLDVGYVF